MNVISSTTALTSWNNLDTTKLVVGLCMLMMNLGSRYLIADLTIDPEAFFNNAVVRRITLFCLFYLATRDLYHAFVLTGIFIILSMGVFNKHSYLCILPEKYHRKDGGNISVEEYQKAKEIVIAYEKVM